MKTEPIARTKSNRPSFINRRTLGVFALCVVSSLASGCLGKEAPEEDTDKPPVILYNNAQDGMDMGSSNAKTPTDMGNSPDMSSDNMTPMVCSVGERCGEECVDTNTDQANCGTCGSACSDGSACLEGVCSEQTTDCRQDACKGFFYCNLTDGQCLEGCDRDEQCNENASCDVFGHDCVCEEGFHGCAGQCVDSTSPQHCGDSCEPCPAPDNGSATCSEDGTCGISCDPGYHRCGDRCVADDSVDHCGSRCEPCPTDPSGGAVCSPAGQCEIQCDGGFRECGGACAACPGDATNTACSGSSCVASSCPGGTLLCAGQCSTCPSDPGASQMTCDARNECVIQSCQSGLELCGDSCKQCPTQNVLSASCNSSGECAIEACPQGRHPCGDSCCLWGSSPSLITRSEGTSDVKLVRDTNTLSLSFSYDGVINSFSYGEHWLLTPANGTWSKAHQYEYDNLQGDFDDLIFGFREGTKNYALFLDEYDYLLVTPAGQGNWTELGSVQEASPSSSVALRGGDGNVYITADNPQSFEPEMYRVSLSSGSRFSKLNLNFPQLHDGVHVNKAGEVFLSFYDVFLGLYIFKQSGANFSSHAVQTCNSAYGHHADFPYVADAVGRVTLLRGECGGQESDGLWASTEVQLGQWSHTRVTSDFDGTTNESTSDKIGNLAIAPDGVLHTCILDIEGADYTGQVSIYHAWRGADPNTTWTLKKVHTGANIRQCVIETTSDSVPHIVWYKKDNANPSKPWAYYHLAPN